MIKKAEAEVDTKIREMGEQALIRNKFINTSSGNDKTDRRLNYRNSYGQNV
jgi:HD superfamily phosphodiesterase